MSQSLFSDMHDNLVRHDVIFQVTFQRQLLLQHHRLSSDPNHFSSVMAADMLKGAQNTQVNGHHHIT